MNKIEQIFQKIKHYNKIVVHRHKRPDPDAVGAQLALADILQTTYPVKQVKAVGKQIDGLAWLGEMDPIDENFFDGSLVIVVDTANTPRIDDNRYERGSEIIKIDHHPNEDPYGDLTWVNEMASSSSEMIYDFYKHLDNELEFPIEAMKNLYAGITSDTGRFLYSATTAHTHEVVASLMNDGLDVTPINQILDSIPEAVARLSAYVYENIKIDPTGAAYIVLNNDVLDTFNLEEAGTAGIVSLPGKIDSVLCWAIFVEQDDGSYRIRLRSKGPKINELAKSYSGGRQSNGQWR